MASISLVLSASELVLDCCCDFLGVVILVKQHAIVRLALYLIEVYLIEVYEGAASTMTSTSTVRSGLSTRETSPAGTH